MDWTKESKMSSEELEEFLLKHNLSNPEFAAIVGVTKGAVNHWTASRRDIPEMVVRLVYMFDDDPDMMDKFESFGPK
jgi:DNA-binding transcriptional regulator YiaG